MTAANGFGRWLEKPRSFLPLTRSAYCLASSEDLLRWIAAAEHDRVTAHTDDDRTEAEFALQEMRAVLQERR